MKRLIIPIFLFFAACQVNQKETDQSNISTQTTVSTDKVSEIREKLFNRDKASVIVVAHRGDWRNFPENSLEAIDHAIEMGVDVVEIDIQRTKDSVLIVMHDQTLDRTTTGKGKISETNYEDIKSLKLKNGINIRTIHNVPTLEEALLHAKGKIMVNLDKADRYFDQVYELLEKTGTTDQIIMKGSRSLEDVKVLYGDYLSNVIYMPIVNLDKPNAHDQITLFMEELNPVAFELLYVSDTNRLAKEVVEILGDNSLIWYNTLWDTMAGGHDDDMSLEDPDKGYGYLIDSLNARVLQTDRPAYLLEYLRSRNLHD